MSGDCRTCEHWEQPWDDFHVMEGPADASRWGTCDLIQLGYGDDVRAFTQDASQYQALLHTRDDFGCVLWAARTEAERPAEDGATS